MNLFQSLIPHPFPSPTGRGHQNSSPLPRGEGGGGGKRRIIIPTVLIVTCTVGYCFLSFQDKPEIILGAQKAEYYPDEFVVITLSAKNSAGDAFKTKPPQASVQKNGMTIQTIGGLQTVSLKYDKSQDLWTGRWPAPWNPPEGQYDLILDSSTIDGALPDIKTTPFHIIRRPLSDLKPGFSVLTFESMAMPRDWTSLVDWAEFVGADALWVLGAETSSYNRKLGDDFPWYARPAKDLIKLGNECHARGLKFGVWVMAYLTGGKSELSPNYKYAWQYVEGRVIDGKNLGPRRSISLSDHKRVDDLTKMLQGWAQIPEVDFIGLDYIRNALGGYELVDEFVEDMNVKIPAELSKRSHQERMLWLAKKKIARKDTSLIDQWQWWRAHKVAGIVREIRNAVPMEKPLWVFTLSWDKGWQHGQDPVMMQSAGIYADAIMLYEADKEQFDSLIKDWNVYLRRKDANLIVGDVIDWPLHQKTVNPAGPEEFLRRTLVAVDSIYGNGAAPGVFLHDLNRALSGRTGPYSSKEWLLAGACAISRLRDKHNESDITVSLTIPDNVPLNARTTGYIALHSKSKANVSLEVSGSFAGISPTTINIDYKQLEAGKINTPFTFTVKNPGYERGKRHYVAVIATHSNGTQDRFRKYRATDIEYFNIGVTDEAHK